MSNHQANERPPQPITCSCRRCRKDDPGGCVFVEAIWRDQVRRGVITEDTYFIAKDIHGVAL